MNSKLIALTAGLVLSSGAMAKPVAADGNAPAAPQFEVRDSMGLHPPQFEVRDSMGLHPPQFEVHDSMGLHPPQFEVRDSMGLHPPQ